MALNTVTLQGKIPATDKINYSFYNIEDEKKALVRGAISVARNFKPAGEQYYPEDLIPFKAFGRNAVFLSKFFKRGDNLIIIGELLKDDDYEKDGQVIRGQLYVNVSQVHFQKGNEKSESGGSSESAPKAAVTAKPAAVKPSLNPLMANRKSVLG